MRVVHFGKFYPPKRGGMESFLAGLCQGLVKKGVECEVIVARDRHDPSDHDHDGVVVRRLRSLGTLRSVPLCPAALGAWRGIQADIIHLHHPNPLAEISYLFSQPRGRLVVTYHSDIVSQPWLSKLYAPLLSSIIERAAVIVATSPQYAASSVFLQRYREKVRIIPLGCHIPDYGTCGGAPDQRRSNPQYFFLGRLVPYKGIPVLLEALRYLPGSLWIGGTGPLEGKLKKQVAQFNVWGRVEFLGNISEEEKFQRLAASDVVVLPSLTRAEAFGIVLLEAMAVGRPVVVSDLPTGVRMLVKDGVNGLRFPPGNARALAAAIRRLIDDPQEAARMGEAGRRLVQEQYTTEQMVDHYFQLYQELCHAR
jgi:glycosyltransferase involved in cell wall biosynthesis